jgi:hypothetical protein
MKPWMLVLLLVCGCGRADVQADPRILLGRVWFDKLPSSRSDEVVVGIWLGGGIGLYDTGSTWRSTIDIFDFERRGSKLDMTFLHDKKKKTVSFEVTKRDDKPPFDLCLTFDDPPRGPKRLYGFGDGGDEASRVPWSKDLVRSAEARAAAARGH